MSLTREFKNVVDSWRVCEQDANGAALALGGELTFSPLHLIHWWHSDMLMQKYAPTRKGRFYMPTQTPLETHVLLYQGKSSSYLNAIFLSDPYSSALIHKI